MKVPYNIDKELEDEAINMEKEKYRAELKEGRYRDMTKIYESFKKQNICVDEI